ncbi:MAG TPA: beta-L-arabinofuranosidase domain-containing protein, partial [Spirochaetia bacterium]|nr:beta-L-arabinofuranosidase domain-containing protein [Spirochaetia bacterium]
MDATTLRRVEGYARLRPLPPGRVVPGGWLRHYLQVTADAWPLLYARNRDPEVYGKFWTRNKTSKVTFDENNVTQVLCDYTAYFAEGLLHYAQLLPESALAREADDWVSRLLSSQDADGYVGAFDPGARWQHWLEVFSQSVVEDAILHRYEGTGDRRLLEACERMARLQMSAWYRPAADSVAGIWTGHGTVVIRSLLKLYELTGDAGYLGCARDILQKHGKTSEFLTSRDALENVHNAVGTEHVGFPALLYEFTGDPSLLVASVSGWEAESRLHLSVDGTPHGNESMLFKGPLHNCEHCGTVEWIYASNALARMTGEVRFADAVERAIHNAYPAARSADGLSVAYMHTPNQIAATEWSQPHGWTSPDW